MTGLAQRFPKLVTCSILPDIARQGEVPHPELIPALKIPSRQFVAVATALTLLTASGDQFSTAAHCGAPATSYNQKSSNTDTIMQNHAAYPKARARVPLSAPWTVFVWSRMISRNPPPIQK